MSDKKEAYQLTPRGFLAYLSIEQESKFIRSNEFWERLGNFCKRRAIADGGPHDGIPCLIFKDGGYCAMVNEKKEEVSDDY